MHFALTTHTVGLDFKNSLSIAEQGVSIVNISYRRASVTRALSLLVFDKPIPDKYKIAPDRLDVE